MKKESENIDFWIGRIIILFFFFFLMSFSNRDSNSQIDNSTLLIEQFADIHNSAILIEPVSFPNYDISLVDCELYDKEINDINFGLWISNNTINQQFKSEELRFFTFKPRLIKLRLITLKASSNEDYLLIS